jgi:hypothetical protein
MKNLILTPLFLFISINSFAGNLIVNKKVAVNGVPTFFFKVSPDGKYFSYTLPSNPSQPAAGGENHILDTASGKTVLIPGPWDPVFNVGSDYITIPKRVSGNKVYYEFYKVKDVLKYGRNASPIGEDRNLTGLYQSVGVLNKTENYIDYRVITERPGSHSMRDYRFDLELDKVEALRSERSLCPNKEVKLPMISKNGLEIGALDVDSGKTTIFSIDESGKCSKLFDLGDKYGKVNFSHDSKKLTFHKYNTNSPDITNGYVAIPSSNTTSDIYIYDRSLSKLTRLTSNTSSNALYPDFLESGKLAYIDHPHDQAREQAHFVIATTNVLNITNGSKFFEELSRHRKSKEMLREYVLTYLISNDRIKVSTMSSYKKYLDVVQEAGLDWSFIEKIAKDNFSLLESKLLREAIESENTQLITHILAESNFIDYEKELNLIFKSFLNKEIVMSSDIEKLVISFLVKSSFLDISDIEIAKQLVDQFKHDSESLIEILSKLRRTNFDFKVLRLTQFLTDEYSTRIHSAILRMTRMKNFEVELRSFLLSGTALTLSQPTKDHLVKKLLRGNTIQIDASLLRRFLNISEKQKENVINTLIRSSKSELFYILLEYKLNTEAKPEVLSFINNHEHRVLSCLSEVAECRSLLGDLSELLPTDSSSEYGDLLIDGDFSSLVTVLATLNAVEFNTLHVNDILKLLKHRSPVIRGKVEEYIISSNVLESEILINFLLQHGADFYLLQKFSQALEERIPGSAEEIFIQSIKLYNRNIAYRALLMTLETISYKETKSKKVLLRVLRKSNIKDNNKELYKKIKNYIKKEWS